jgi:hypothetical protein
LASILLLFVLRHFIDVDIQVFAIDNQTKIKQKKSKIFDQMQALNLKEEAAKLETQLESSCHDLKLSKGEPVPSSRTHTSIYAYSKAEL